MKITLPTNDKKSPRVEKKEYGEITSDNPEYISNLQLFSLKQAYRYFEEFQKKESNLTKFQKLEYVVFIIVCAGTSISQLLGQNTTHNQKQPGSTHVDGLKNLFKRIFGEKDELGNEFNEFINDYDACRHFGSPKHSIVSNLTIEKCRQHLDLIVKIWDKTVRKYIAGRKDSNNELREFVSVLDIINNSP